MTNPRPKEEQVAHAGRTAQGERRIVTVLFCDVVGSTAMAERLDPEEWTEVMNEAFEYLSASIHHYEGTVSRLMGDAILSFFGAPHAHEDDPERAILASLQIMENIQPFRDHIKREHDLDFNVRIGINTGSVVAGEVGSDLATEYTAMGDAVNVAARMEQTAQPGTVQISGSTHKLVAPLFEFESLGAMEVKGKSEPVPAYRVLGRKATPGRLRGIPGLNAPLIGRDSEMERLREVIAGVRQGRGQIVCLIGEAGLGKSRLLAELRVQWQEEAGDQPTWAESRGISYDSSRPYSLFTQRMRQFFGIEDKDTPEVMRQKMAKAFQLMEPEQQALCTAAVGAMMAVQKESDKPDLPPEVLKREVFNNMLDAWRGMTSRTPVALVFDDLHWADPASAEVIMHLFHLAEEAPILFLFAFRPERQSQAWRIKQHAETEYPHRYTEIEIKPLSSTDTDVLVSNLLAIADLPPALRHLILQKTEGNPFFVEEVVRTLIDSGAVVRDQLGMRWRAATRVEDISIPDNLQSLLMARIDRLQEEARHTLQLASVIGRSFYHRVLKVISATALTLDKQLTTLQKAELIREAARIPELEYMFRHELTRDAAYSSILRRRRREFHRRVGEAIETLFPDRLEDEAHRLAHHFHEGGDNERAIKYYTMAGDMAARLNANAEAITHYTHAAELAKESTDSNLRLIHLYTRRGRALELSGRYDEALANYQELEALGGQRHDQALKLAALVPQATIHSTYTAKFAPDRGRSLSEEALSLAREMNNPRAEVKALWNLMLLEHFAMDNPRQAVVYGEQSLAIARQNSLQEELPYVLNDLARAYNALNQRSLAQTATHEARELWRAQGNFPILADRLQGSGGEYVETGEFDKAEPLLLEGLRLSRSIGNPWGQAVALCTLSPIYMERGNFDEAIKALEEAIPLAEQAKFAAGLVSASATLAWIYGLLGDFGRGIKIARRSLVQGDQGAKYRWYALGVLAHLQRLQGDLASAEATIREAQKEPEGQQSVLDMGFLGVFAILHLVAGEFTLARRDHQGALAEADRILASMQSRGVRIFLPDTLAFKARALLPLGRTQEARQALEEARAEAEAQGSRRALWPILHALSQLEGRQGNLPEAERLRHRASEIVAYIAEHTGTPEMSASFLASQPVQAFLDAEPPSPSVEASG